MIPLRDSVPARSWPVVTWVLIGVNVWVFLYELLLGPGLEAFVRTWGFVPRATRGMRRDADECTGRVLALRSARECRSLKQGGFWGSLWLLDASLSRSTRSIVVDAGETGGTGLCEAWKLGVYGCMHDGIRSGQLERS